MKVILQDEYKDYENRLAQLGIEDLKSRREYLCLEFAKKYVYLVQHVNTGWLQDSAIIYMQKLINEDQKKQASINPK